MQEDEQNTNEEQQAPEEAQEEQPAPAEEQALEANAEQAPAEEQPSEEIDLEQYWKERYPAHPSGDNRDLAADVQRELAQLPADEYGNVDANAAAEWFARKFSEVESRAGSAAMQRAEQAAMAVVSETAQQNQLLKKYPEIARDKETLDAVFDLRDAAALRGQSLTLSQAAERLNKLRQQGREEGSKSAARQTTIQAAAHLETSSVKGSNSGETERLAQTAFQGSGQEAKTARQELLRRYVEKEVKEGRIQAP